MSITTTDYIPITPGVWDSRNGVAVCLAGSALSQRKRASPYPSTRLPTFGVPTGPGRLTCWTTTFLGNRSRIGGTRIEEILDGNFKVSFSQGVNVQDW